jgi:patatin-like phospholipase/acyl hydrolase
MFESSHSYSILSIDGGGIRGIIPCLVLAKIEQLLENKQIGELFDLVSGTSTGGILAAGLVKRTEDEKFEYPAKELLKLYLGEEGKKIFSRPLGPVNFFRQLFASKFSDSNVEEIMQDFFADYKLSQAHPDILITSYDTEAKKPFYFSSLRAKQEIEQWKKESAEGKGNGRFEPEEDFYLRDVTRATSAAPTYFPPKMIPQRYEQFDRLSLVDGGVFANNPSLLAYLEGKLIWKDSRAYNQKVNEYEDFMDRQSKGMYAQVSSDNYEAPFLLVSIGTGQTKRPYTYERVRTWGAASWVKPIIDILMQGVSESVHYQMQYLLPPFNDEQQTPRYFRLNIELDQDYSGMDDVSEPTLRQLINYAGDILYEEGGRIPDKENLPLTNYAGAVIEGEGKTLKPEIGMICELLEDLADKRQREMVG